MMVVEHFYHATTGGPLQVRNRFQAEKCCSPCASRASSFHRCGGNGAITPSIPLGNLIQSVHNYKELLFLISSCDQFANVLVTKMRISLMRVVEVGNQGILQFHPIAKIGFGQFMRKDQKWNPGTF